ncbi:8-oxo-dGTP pyrophosphatase MutT (NUDIX family) [Arthrobacter pigmenti]|uniref:8-oxo-dGTP pyrophosphatase MutT (NUDIX family) n=1 Tax=Arthrobacter pigmenti TaxID=271432 RepID=A0A846REA0_9MICC|nr:NUDIX hydrolase [Arthrobacter pigmenti]NJC21353.1 8-oxo-dGTP pyrophosphatase MutT (NUDIX family) [Arthrobacter pigmenti]
MSSSSAPHAPNSDEWWDVTDEHGHPTGQTYRRGDPDWPSGRFHLIVATCIYRHDGAVLLTQRSATKEFPLTWEFPGGSAFSGESSKDAARRELREETGLQVPASGLIFVERFRESSALMDLYTAPAGQEIELTLCPDEVATAEWVTLDELQFRLQAGEMALPWKARLEKLWTPLVDVLREALSAARAT